MDKDEKIRLNKLLALRMGVSRRAADELISAGKVAVNGKTASLGNTVLKTDNIKVNNQSIAASKDFVYLAFNKPVGYVCSRRQQGDSPTIYSILPAKYQQLKPVGRLDKNSSGLLLLANDGDFAHRMTHPTFAKNKTYQVSLDKDLEPLHQQMIADFGVSLQDGTSKLGLSRLNDSSRKDWQVNMSEGRNRQIRRTFAALGYEVTRLHRINFGIYILGDLPTGEYITIDIK